MIGINSLFESTKTTQKKTNQTPIKKIIPIIFYWHVDWDSAKARLVSSGEGYPNQHTADCQSKLREDHIPNPPITNRQSPIANCQLPIANPQSPIPNRQPQKPPVPPQPRLERQPAMPSSWSSVLVHIANSACLSLSDLSRIWRPRRYINRHLGWVHRALLLSRRLQSLIKIFPVHSHNDI